MQPRQVAIRLAALAIGLCLAFLAGELSLRLMLSSRAAVFSAFRNPSLYADYRSDDAWWKLYLELGGIHQPPASPHPLLGWVHHLDPVSYRHPDAGELGSRRPVLLFGDSFADCVDDTPCFEDVLNADPEFARDHYLLNYGVGGYGLDQIFLLMRQVVGRYERPLVVFSFMLEDVDRCVLSFRGGQKPVFRLEGGELKLTNVPIDPRPSEWLARHPIGIPSYFLEFLKRAPRRAWGRLRGKRWNEESRTEEKQRIGGAILAEAFRELRERRLPFSVLVFHPFTGRSWRDDFVRRACRQAEVPCKGTEEIVRESGRLSEEELFAPETRRRFMLADLDHPNALQNRLVAEHIKDWVLGQP